MADIIQKSKELLGLFKEIKVEASQSEKTRTVLRIIKNSPDPVKTTKPFKSRKLLEAELDDIIEVIDVWPSAFEESGKAIRDRQREIIRDKFKVKDVIDHPDIVSSIKGKLRTYWMRGAIPAGTPLGYIVGDDSAAAVMQGTLNARHKPGSRQNAGGGIKNQREIILLQQRSNPVIVAAFEEKQSFRSIMEYWRPKWVETTLNILAPESEDVSIIALDGEEPKWWSHFRDYFPDSKKVDPLPKYVLQYHIDRQQLLTYNLSLSRVKEMIMGSLKAQHKSIVDVYFTPLVDKDVLVHIIPIPSTLLAAYNRPGLPAEIALFNEYYDTWESSGISGIEGVKGITPISKKVIEAIQSEISTGAITTLNLVPEIERFFGVGPSEVADLVRACGFNVIDTQPNKVIVNRILFEPASWLKRHTSIRSIYGSLEVNNIEGDIVVEAISPEAASSIVSFMKSKKINVKYDQTKSFTILKADIPLLSLIDEIKHMQTIDQEIRVQAEEERRTNRVTNNTEDTILDRNITAIEMASLHWLAELNGGNFKTILMEDGVDTRLSFCNDAREMNRVFGIRAARNFLMLEIEETWTNSGYPLQPKSIELMADIMVYSGSLTPSSMAGITSTRMGFLAKMTVHAASRWMAQAALNIEPDYIRSSASAIVVGQRNRSGTGMMDVIVPDDNDKAIPASMPAEINLPDIELISREYIVSKDDS